MLLGLALIAGGLYWHFLRSGPAPAPWHDVPLADFTAAQADTIRTLDDYQALEQRLFADLRQQVYGAVAPADRIAINRYHAGSRSDPGAWPVNWNRTFRLDPAPGTAPRDRPLYLVGYSNGAALAVDYALAALDDAALPVPTGLVLISPAIAISKLAAVARIRTGLSSVPGFERAAWQVIVTEFDPFKYHSFSFNAADETFRLTRGLARAIERKSAGQPLRGFPPVLAFLSTVDSTVRAEAVADTLLDRLAPDGHELVLFDVNRQSDVQPLLVSDPGPLTDRLRSRTHRPYGLTVITNAAPDSLRVVEQRAPAESGQLVQRALDLAWPRMTFSLSHVVLQVPMWALTRQRSNPFHGYLIERLDEFVDATAAR